MLSAWPVLLLGIIPVRTAVGQGSKQGLDILNKTLSGRIQAIEPFALPCFSTFSGKSMDRDSILCAERQANYKDPFYRRKFPAGYMYETSSINASDPESQGQCLLDSTNPENSDAWEGRDCELGNLPSHYLEVRSAEDAIHAFEHAAKFNLHLSIKNSGHTYVEDAGAKGSLMLWTQNLKNLTHVNTFAPNGCPTTKIYNAISTGAGVSCGEAYHFANEKGVMILCGYSPTVGLSGGWVMGGGHSVLSNAYGLGADRVVQFQIVTPDGKLRFANECQNPELFWALRGGGGGTFGLVIESTHIVELQAPLSVASIGLPASAADEVNQFMDLLVDKAVAVALDGWGGHIYGTHIVYVNPLVQTVSKAKSSMRDITNFVRLHGGTSNITVLPSWYCFYQQYVLSGAYSVGNLQLIGTQLAPVELFSNKKNRNNLKQFFRHENSRGNLPYIPVGSPFLARRTLNQNHTSVNPAWYDSLWEIGIGDAFQWNSTFDERCAVVRGLQQGTENLQRLTLGGAAYKNEADPFTKNWKKAWYGAHYDKLLEIKKTIDPDGLLNCFNCIGWDDRDAKKSTYGAFL